ncbi:MAG: hypothetical protein V4649_08025 [Bacteroidota bacterium]
MKTLKLTVLAIAILAGGAKTVKAQNANEIIQKHIDAVGGEKNWSKVTGMKLTGNMSMGGADIGVTQTVVNDKGMRMDISAMGVNGYTIVTPKEGWMYMPFGGSDKVMPIPADQMGMYKDKLNVKNGQLVDKSLITKAEYAGIDTLNSVPCHKLKVTGKDGSMQTCYIDAATYYMVRTEAKVQLQGEEREEGVNFSNFKKLEGGVTMPLTFGTSQGDIVFRSIEINPKVDDNIFKPTEVKK